MSNKINLFYFGGKNFGDAVSKIFWEKITNCTSYFDSTQNHYITIGSIINLVSERSIILGSGFISKNGDVGGGKFSHGNNKIYKKPLKIICVRGPLTRNKLIKNNIKCPKHYGDPLILMPCIYNNIIVVKKEIIGIIPHYADKNNNNVIKLIKNMKKKGFIVKLIDIEVGSDYKNLINKINTCKYIISSSLHGIMMGIVYKKITCYCKFSNNVIGNTFKFDDFLKSLNYNHNFGLRQTFNSSILENYIKIDYANLVNMGINLIQLLPFVDDNRKSELINIYHNFYNNNNNNNNNNKHQSVYKKRINRFYHFTIFKK